MWDVALVHVLPKQLDQPNPVIPHTGGTGATQLSEFSFDDNLSMELTATPFNNQPTP
jgi:hypothetical protein